MKPNKKKGDEDLASDLIKFAIDARMPPLYHSIEIDGVIVKQYPFIRGHSSTYKRSEPIPKQEISTTDVILLSARKTELESQLELHHKYCTGQYNHIKLATKNWLSGKLNRIGLPLQINEIEDQIHLFMAQINTMITWLMLGVEVDNIKKDLSNSFAPSIEAEPVIWDQVRMPVTLDINDLIDKLKSPIEKLNRVVSRSVPLYFEYVNIHSHIYELDIDAVLSEAQSDYGFHQQKREWIESVFTTLKNGSFPKDENLQSEEIKKEIESAEGRGLSDNRVAKQVSILYKHKFNGMSISHHQVKGMVVYRNR